MKLLKKDDKFYRFVSSNALYPIQNEKSLVKWIGSGKNPSDYSAVGDILKIGFDQLESEIYTGIDDLVIIGLNHTTYGLANPYNITLQHKDDMFYTRDRFNLSANQNAGWRDSDVRIWSNNSFKERILNDSIRNAIQEVDVQYCETPRSDELTTVKDYCFLLSYNEVFGNSPVNSAYEKYLSFNEGLQFEYYTTDLNRIKDGANTTHKTWWLRTRFSQIPYATAIVKADGTVGYLNSTLTTCNRFPAFVLAA